MNIARMQRGWAVDGEPALCIFHQKSLYFSVTEPYIFEYSQGGTWAVC